MSLTSRSHPLRVWATVALVASAALLAGCSTPAAPAEPAASDTSAAFPVTVRHALGETVVAAAPQRIVTLGPQSLDTVLALGIDPVGAVMPFYSPEPLPWQRDHLDTAATTLVPGTPDFAPNYEAIAALTPDLIVGPDLFTMAEAYPRLTAIAPTVAAAADPQTDTWQETTRLVGTALGRQADTERLVAAAEQGVRDTRAAHPVPAGSTWSLAVATGTTSLGVLTNEQDPLADMMTELGLTRPQSVAALQPGPAGVAPVSLEQVRAIEADLMIVVYPSPDVRAAIEANPLVSALPTVGGPGYLAADLVTGTGLRTPSLLALPWALGQVGPALDGVRG